MKFTSSKEALLPCLTLANSIVQKKQTLAILSNLLLDVNQDSLRIVSTDLELEFETRINVEVGEQGSVTVPARKLFDIVRNHPDGSTLELTLKDNHVQVRSNSRRFSLNTMSVEDFPTIRGGQFDLRLNLTGSELKDLIESTSFSIAQQDVRYYLNGLYMDIGENTLRAVATDGHRMAVSESAAINVEGNCKGVIVPRKCILELNRLLADPDQEVLIQLNKEFIEFKVGENRLISRLIDGSFPDYQKVIPKDCDKKLIIDRQILRDAINRVSVLSNENYKSVEFDIRPSLLKLKTHNTDQDEAEEELSAEFSGKDEMILGFNCSYFLDVLGVIKSEKVQIELKDASSGCLIEAYDDKKQSQYVIMPMRL
ncbi:MAG: DNA polymerase III subunit beta [Gammaproteobacteria bacterium]|nr:MAG: DNA polymerase III subunit beta [Gammaproteobacteria bacterium]